MSEKWDRQPNESYPAYEAFREFLGMNERSYQRVAEKLSKSATLIKRWAKNNHWRERADAWDAELNDRALEQAAQDYAAMITRQISVGRLFQVKAANAIQQMDFNNLPPKFIPALATLAQTGVKIERSARDLQRSNEPTQENLFVTTLNKIWGADDDE